MKFRKKPVVVEAVQWTRAEDGPPSFNHEAKLRVDQTRGQWAWSLFVEKSQAWCDLALDDWIIREPDGQGFYPCKPDFFATIYEPVDFDPLAHVPSKHVDGPDAR